MFPDDGIDELAERLGVVVTDRQLLAGALAHRSWCAEAGNPSSNERLEFLGDAVLGLVVTHHLFLAYPDLNEGELAKLRAAVVSEPALAEAANELGLGERLLLGKGEDATGGRQKPSLLADALEAVIGAVYLDGGLGPASALVLRLLADAIAGAAELPGIDDYKTRLQELAARSFDDLPRYEHHHEGPDHDRWFHATVELGGEVRGRGEGRTKKAAEQAAARQAYRGLAGDGADGVGVALHGGARATSGVAGGGSDDAGAA